MNYEFKGTKEKWELAKSNSIQIYPNEPLKMSTICVVYGKGEEMEANRHIISAAPCMLQVLTEILKAIENETDPRDIIEYKEDKIRTAIHKALNIQS